MTARERYDLMIRDEVGPWLRERGFRKRRNRFRREDAEGWAVVDFQASQWGSRDDVRFTINLWVGVPELTNGDGSDVQVEVRIERLMEGGEDHWWDVRDGTDTRRLARELRRVLDERALPWLDARNSLTGPLDVARNDPDNFPRYSLERFAMLLERADRHELAAEVAANARTAPA